MSVQITDTLHVFEERRGDVRYISAPSYQSHDVCVIMTFHLPSGIVKSLGWMGGIFAIG